MVIFKFINKYTLFFCISLAFICIMPDYLWAFNANVIKISDGDTLQVKKTNGEIIKIRLYGIDCPESSQKFGSQATQFTTKTVLNQSVSIKNIETDQYGRMVAIVTPLNSSQSLNELLVQNGYAWYYANFCKSGTFCKQLKQLEKTAQNQQLGLWGAADPIPPWAYRKGVRDYAAANNDDDWLWDLAVAFKNWLVTVLKNAYNFYID